MLSAADKALITFLAGYSLVLSVRQGRQWLRLRRARRSLFIPKEHARIDRAVRRDINIGKWT